MPLLRFIPNLPFSCSLPLTLLQHIKNPNKTLNLQSLSSRSTIMSWSCSSCTFLNPPSQKSTCQICQTPSSSSAPSPLPLSSSPLTSSSTHKWACKACTFLNTYSRSNCEICDTRSSFSSLSNFEDLDPDGELGGSSSVGSVFFPLRRCNTVNEEIPVGFSDSGVKETVRNGGDLGEKGVELGVSRNSKRKFQGSASETSVAGNCFSTNKKAGHAGAEKGSVSIKIAENADSSIKSQRKLRDLGDFVEKPIEVEGFHGVKSSWKELSDIENANATNDFVRAIKLGNVGAVTGSASASREIKILSYNIWFREELEVHGRMQAIGDLIQLHSPDVICLQEVTPYIYGILQKSTWWKKYSCSLSHQRPVSESYFCMQLAKLPVKSFSCKPFSYSAMARELFVAEVKVSEDKSLIIATSHLESPSPGPPKWDQYYSKERVNQAKDAINFLQNFPNVIFCGDMNWDDKRDGLFPLVEGWFDAWEKLRPGEVGYTYDTKSNKMLSGYKGLQKRLDRFVCHLPDFEVNRIEMIGTEAIPGLTHTIQKKMKNKIQELTLPVLPSDHYGLLLTITTRI